MKFNHKMKLIFTFQKNIIMGLCPVEGIPPSVKGTSFEVNQHAWICDLFILKDGKDNQHSY